MELSVMSPVLAAMSLEDSLAYLKKLGVDSFEIGAGGYPGKAHLDPKDYLGKPEKIEELKALLKKYDMKISAVACHGNPVHPNREIAKKFHEEFVDAMKIAALLGTDTIIGFSGCPGDCEDSKNPNWVAGISRYPRMAVGKGHHSLLERDRRARKGDRHQKDRIRNAPRLLRL